MSHLFPQRSCAALTAERALCLVALRADGNGRADNFRQDVDSGCRYSDNIHSGFEMTDVRWLLVLNTHALFIACYEWRTLLLLDKGLDLCCD